MTISFEVFTKLKPPNLEDVSFLYSREESLRPDYRNKSSSSRGHL